MRLDFLQSKVWQWTEVWEDVRELKLRVQFERYGPTCSPYLRCLRGVLQSFAPPNAQCFVIIFWGAAVLAERMLHFAVESIWHGVTVLQSECLCVRKKRRICLAIRFAAHGFPFPSGISSHTKRPILSQALLALATISSSHTSLSRKTSSHTSLFAVAVKQPRSLFRQDFHLANCRSVQLHKPFRLACSALDQIRVQVFKIGKTN